MTNATVTKPGNHIAQIRKARGVTALALAESLGVRETTIMRWQRGENDPSISQMHKLCEILDCSLDDLFPREEATA